MKIFLDANIIFSAAKSDGAIRRLLHLAVDRNHELWVDAFVLEEASRNLLAKAKSAVQEFDGLSTLWSRAQTLPQGMLLPKEIDLHKDDRPVLAAAIHGRCHALVTGDKTHFGKLYGTTIGGVTIHSPRSLAELLLR